MADIEDFDLNKTTKQVWDEFTERLVDVLSVTDASADLTIPAVNGEEIRETPPAVRFLAVEPGVVEATLVGVDSLWLMELGWTSLPRGFITRRDQEEATELANLITATMTEVVGVLRPILLEPDQLAELLTARESDLVKPTPGPYGVVLPTSQAQLDAIVDAELEKIFGYPVLRNAAGEVVIRVGSIMAFCRSIPDFEELVPSAVLMYDVNGRSQAYEVLDGLNVESRYCRFALYHDRVFVQVLMLAQPFVPRHLRQASKPISHAADGIDGDLAHKLGGRTTFPITS